MAFNKWTKQATGSTQGGTLMLETHSPAGSEPNFKNRSEYASITDKINKALQDIDNIYDEDKSGDPLVEDIHSQLSSMPNGDLKVKLTSFLLKYEHQQQQNQEVVQQRDDVLNSLAEWFSQDHFGDDFLTDSPASDSLMTSVVDTKMGFTQLRQLTEQIATESQRGESVADLQRQKEQLQKSVLAGFNETKEIKHRETMINQMQEQPGDSGWKHAANEICDLLGKVRGETADYAVQLEKKVNALINNREKADRKIRRLENVLREKQALEKKWADSNNALTGEKAHLENKFRALKKEFRKARNLLANHERVARSRFDGGGEEDGEDEEVVAEDVWDMVKEAQLRDTKRQIDTLQDDVKDLQDKVVDLEELLEQKEEEVDSLMQDKRELLHQMKQASVRPDVRRLSDPSSTGLSSRVPSTHTVVGKPLPKSSLRSTALQSSSRHLLKGKCSTCGCHQVARQPSSTASSLTMAAKTETVMRVNKEEVPTSSLSSQVKDNEPDIVRPMLEEIAALKERVASLEAQLARSHQEVVQLKSLSAPRRDPYPTPVSTPEVSMPTPRDKAPGPPPTGQAIKHTLPVAATSPADDVKMEVEGVEKPAPPPESEPPRGLVAGVTPPQPEVDHTVQVVDDVINTITRTTWARPSTLAPSDGMTVTLTTQGVQTDPSLDPLSGWTQPIVRERGWRPPMPPMNWVEFDPTVTAHDPVPLGDEMLTGMEPSELRQELEHVASFLQTQMLRLIQGIQGLRDYAGMVADRETKEMVDANRKLKSKLTPEERQQVEIMLASSADSGTQEGKLKLGITGVKKAEERGETIAFKLKGTLASMTNKTVLLMEEALSLVNAALKRQHLEYENVYATIQQRPQHHSDTIFQQEDLQLQPQLKRSLSETNLDSVKGAVETQRTEGIVGFHLAVPKDGLHPRRSHSHADIVIAEQHIQGMPQDKSDNTTRKTLLVSQATVPRKGQIQLLTPTTKKSELPTTMFNPFGSKDGVHRKTRPVPISHQKLQSRQKALLKKTTTPFGSRLLAPSSDATQKQKPAPVAQTVQESYTLADLERRAEQFVETSSKQQKAAMMAHLSDMPATMLQRVAPETVPHNVPPFNTQDAVLPPIAHPKHDPQVSFPPLRK